MKTTNVYGEDNLTGDHNVICPYCGKRMRPNVFTHNDVIDGRPVHYQRMCSFKGEYGVFMVCASCGEMFFAYSTPCMDNTPTVTYNNPSICGSANMYIKANLVTADMLPEIEAMFAHKNMDITVYRPYGYKAGYIDDVPAIELYTNNDQLICTVTHIDTAKFINDNVKVLVAV